MTQIFRYRAFLSYSHKDKAWADWIHKALESFALGDDLAGRETEAGIVPKTLSPIFRDRDDFSAGPSLASQSLSALESSHSLVVLCSPRAAQSPYVNEEIRAFKALGRETRVFALIIDGEPSDPARECFPPALRFNVSPDGALTDSRVEPIAADARTEGDGKRVALVKIVAGITGLPFNDIRKREVLAHKRVQRIRAALAASISILAIGTGVFGWQTWQKGEQVQQQQAQIFQTQDLLKSLIGSAQAQGISLSPDQQQALGKTLGDTAAQAASGDKRAQKALELLQAGKQAEATALYQQIADDKAAQAKAKTAAADRDRKDAAAAYRRLGSIAEVNDPKAAREAYSKAINLDPSDQFSLFLYSALAMKAGQIQEAERAALALKHIATTQKDDDFLARALYILADISTQKERWSEALQQYTTAREIFEILVLRRPGSHEDQLNLALTYARIGTAQASMGEMENALQSQQISWEMIEKIAASNRNDEQMSVQAGQSLGRISDVLKAQGKQQDALDKLIHSLVFFNKFIENSMVHRDALLAYSSAQQKIADIYYEKTKFSEASAGFHAAWQARDKLVKIEPENLEYQRLLTYTLNNLGNVKQDMNDLPGAMEAFQSALTSRARLAAADPTNRSLQNALARSYNQVGMLRADLGELTLALAAHREALTIIEKLATAAPENRSWQRNLAMAHEMVGGSLLAQGDLERALSAYEASLAVSQKLVAANERNGVAPKDVDGVIKTISQLKAALAKQKN